MQLPRGAFLRRPAVVLALLALAAVVTAVAGATAQGPDGLISYRAYFDADHSTGALFVANPDGSHAMQITDPGPGGLDTNQNWSPDGTQLVYEHDTPSANEIWVVGALGANPHRIVPCPGPGALADCVGVANPSWSPVMSDGKTWIAFSMARGPFVNDNPTDVTIWAVRPDGTGLRQITHDVGFQQSFDDAPTWSPGGNRIAFVRNEAPLFKTEVWAADSTTGGDLVRVSPPGINGGDHPDYSPDGQWIMFRTDGSPGSPKLLMAHPDGTALRVLLDGSNRQQLFSSSFSPRGDGFTVGIAPGAGPDGNADVFVGTFDDHLHVASLTDITNSDIWESSPRWGTAPLLH
jgi:TolB protein